ncbi:MAG TPA: response regulator [Caldimonas sp.]|jgi:CheY-like chemotaxis protein|nr:response regulator [Caldimonas sp.]HEX2542075.1 response regulator [Caldimonas sp.]
MIACGRSDDLREITAQLAADHARITGSTDSESSIRDFEAALPQVVVLAFDTILKSQQYLLALYRRSEVASSHRHRIVLLCSHAEARAAYELCKKGCYDDYVLHWPLAHDGLRLSMSVWNAAQAVLRETSRVHARELSLKAEQVRSVQAFFERELAEGQRFSDTVTGALDHVEVAVDKAIDEFGRRVAAHRPGEAGMLRDPEAFARELERLKRDGVQQAFREGSRLVDEAAAWPAGAKNRLDSVAEQVRGLSRGMSAPQVTLMVVEDDEVQRELIAGALHGRAIDVLMLADGASLVGAIRRRKPDMILMDINLPDADGVTLTGTICGLPRLQGVPVLMLTGDASRESLARSIEAGAVGYIVKPFTRDTLLRNIDRFLPVP